MTAYDYVFYANPLWRWAYALAIAGAALGGMLLLRYAISRRLGAYASKTDTRIDDLLVDTLNATSPLLLLPVALFAGAQVLTLPMPLANTVGRVAVLALIVQGGLWGGRLVSAWLTRIIRRKREEDAASATTLTVLGFVARVGLWTLVLLLALDNLGFNISALLAGLGIGGVAVALAAQSILGDLFASLAIALDRPLAIGDFIVIGDHMGTVEYIGLKTTRLRSLGGEQIVFSNSDLLSSRLHNYGRMRERRVQFSFGVTYDTPADLLESIPAEIRRIVEGRAQTRFDRAHFKDFGDSSLNYEVVYYVLDPDYNKHMDILHAINIALMRRFQELRVAFAFPVRVVYTQGAARGYRVS